MASVWGELKRRNVVKVAVAYAIVGWLLVQVADTFFPALQLPDWTVTLVAGLVILGFPLALILSWAYELTPDGMERTKSVPLPESITKVTGRKLDFVIIGLLLFALVYVFLDNYVLEEVPQREIVANESIDSSVPTGLQEQPELLPNSVAVLPFENLSADPEHAYFADGVHQSIISQLTGLRDVTVIARTSVLQYQDSGLSAPEIADELRVETVMEGSVRYDATNRVLVTAQLIDGVTGATLWAREYLRDLSDVFVIQAAIAMEVANALEAELTPVEQAAIGRQRPVVPEAFTLYLRAITEFTGETFDRTIDEAIEIDSNFAMAYAVKAYRTAFEVLGIFGTNPCSEAECERTVREFALKALELEPTLGTAHAALAALHTAHWRGREAEEAFQRAEQYSPNNAQVLVEYGRFKRFRGELDEAIELHRRAAAIDPNSYGGHHALGISYRFAGNYEEAAAAFNKSLEYYPSLFPDLINLAIVEAAAGNRQAALNTINRINSLSGVNELPAFRVAQLADAYMLLGERDEVRRLIGVIEELDREAPVSDAIWSRVLLAMGDREQALERLETAVEARLARDVPTLADFYVNSLNNPVLEQDEFRELLNQLWIDE